MVNFKIGQNEVVTSGQNEKWSKWKVVKMKSGQNKKWSKWKFETSGQNEKWLKWKVVTSGQKEKCSKWKVVKIKSVKIVNKQA